MSVLKVKTKKGWVYAQRANMQDDIRDEAIANAVAVYMEENPIEVETDKTLSADGVPADAKVTGEAIAQAKQESQTGVTEAKSLANEAKNSAGNAQSSANNAQGTANSALAKANQADETANFASALAGDNKNAVEQIAEKVGEIVSVPSSTTSDNGKFLRVSNGVAAWETVPYAEEASV